MEPTQQALEGVVERFIYKNEQTGYAVCVLQVKNNASAIATGFMSTLNHWPQKISGIWTHKRNWSSIRRKISRIFWVECS